MFSKLKQFKDLKDRAKTIQSALAEITAEGSANWGKVKITVNGNQQLTKVILDPSAMEDKTKLEEAIKDAANDAMQKVQKEVSGKVRDLGGLDIMNEMNAAMKKE